MTGLPNLPLSTPRAEQLKKARRVFWLTLGLNLAVAAAKLSVGFVTGTLTMIADGLHSALDASANVVGIIALTISAKPPDAGHPYGHRKFEALAAMIISGFMFITCFEILQEAGRRLVAAEPATPAVGILSYLVMAATMLVNLGVSRYEARQARLLANELLAADAKHTLSDVYASAAVVATLVAIQMHFPLLDLVASLGIVLVIVRAGYGIIMTHLGLLVDAAILDPQFVEQIVMSVPGVSGCHKIRSRGMHDHVFLDLHVQVPRSLSIEEAHGISFLVEERIREAAGPSIDVLVHIEDDTSLAGQERASQAHSGPDNP